MKSKKLGIMGGTFDPVHLGHLQTAKFIYEHLGLEKIIFVPAFIAPHKVGLEFAPAADRYRMTELATEPFLILKLLILNCSAAEFPILMIRLWS